MSSNLPPGVTQAMIDAAAGGDPAAEAFGEAFTDKLEELIKEHGPLTEADGKFASQLLEWTWKKMGDSYSDGYRCGGSDEAAAREQAKKKDLAGEYWAEEEKRRKKK